MTGGMRRSFVILVILVILGGVAPAARAEPPQEDWTLWNNLYQRCLYNCGFDGCSRLGYKDVTYVTGGCVEGCRNGGPKDGGAAPDFDLGMKLTGWTCQTDCKYRCMHTLQTIRRSEGLPPAKFYGKWSFTRVFGVQEIVSTLASLANMGVHLWFIPSVYAAARNRKSGAPTEATSAGPGSALARTWLVNAAINANAWLWSAVFHTRDTRWTEFMDYTSANLLMFSALYCVLVRTFELDNRRSAGLFFAFFAWLVSHVWMVNNPPDRSVESYRWEVNMRVMMTIAVAHWAIVLPWAYGCRLRRGGFGSGNRRRLSHPGRHSLALFAVLWHLAALAEVFDFPPIWGYLDSHALWHCGTPHCIWLWYRFLKEDLRWDGVAKKDQ